MKTPRPRPFASRGGALLCALTVGACILLTWPVSEMAISDDFSYTRSAFDYARTGHILYNGWSAPMVGWQIVWGGLIAKIFGYSFTSVRMSMVPIAMAAVYLLHRVLVHFGINCWNATIGALTLGLSPIFLPLAASFMTDVPAVFCILLCLYMCQCAVQSASDRAAVVWLAAAALSNVLDGTVRQIVWLGALVMVPSAGWLLRGQRRVLAAAAVLWLASLLGIVACLHWFHQQPYSVDIKSMKSPFSDLLSSPFLGALLLFALTLLLFSLPLLVASHHGLHLLSVVNRTAARISILFAVAVLLLLGLHHPPELVLALWLPNVVTPYGMSKYPEVAAYPLVLGPSIRLALTVLVLTSFVAMVAFASTRPAVRRSSDSSVEESFARQCRVLTLPFALAYGCTILLFTLRYGLFDRYVLPLLPIVILLSVLFYQHHIGPWLPWSTVLVLLLFAGYSVAGTHDYFSTQRARAAAIAELVQAGVPREHIHGSLEYDAWTQLQMQNHLNEPKIQIPADAYKPAPHLHPPAPECRFWFADYTPAVHPKYLVIAQPSECFERSPFAPIKYRLWLPPFSGTMYIQTQRAGVDWID